jgi:DNA modification methylase/ribosomal protein L12E/L44/L45/RPP1/RPP2
MTALGFTHADVVVVDYDEETHLARMLAANAHSGKNDEDKLDALLASLRDASVDPVLALLSALPPAPPPPAGDADAEPDTDRAAELNKIWQVETGQVWQIGPHRLMCGDSTSRQDVQRLMNGEMAKLVVTDPPYGVDYQGGTTKRKKLSGDGNADLYGPILKLAFEFSDEKCAVYLWHSDSKSAAVSAAVSAAGYERRVTIIWNKNLAQFGALGAQYKTKHEPCLYLYKKGNSPRWFGPTNEVTVWDEDRNQVNEHHPTEKPVSVMLRPVRNSSEAGDVVLDLFLGSGTTMLAAQNLHRICYGMEISPDYCAVILDRMHRAFPDLEIKRVA